MKRFLTIITLLVLPFAMSAQRLLWDIDFTTQFDNREYKSDVALPQTIFGMKGTPSLGYKWEDYYLMLGHSYIQDFGSRGSVAPSETILYFGFRDDKYNILAGRLPRENLRGRYNTAFMSDSVRFYDHNIDGMVATINWPRGYFEFACDWDSRQTDEIREKFTILSSGAFSQGWFFAGYTAMLRHHAGSGLVRGVTDNFWLNPYIGVEMSNKQKRRSLRLDAGPLMTFQNDRVNVGHYENPMGTQINLLMELKSFGIDNMLYMGEDLMPYYERFGNGLYWGDPFFRTLDNGVYDRLELFWHPVSRNGVSLKLSSVHHFDGQNHNWQQLFTVKVAIGSFRQYP